MDICNSSYNITQLTTINIKILYITATSDHDYVINSHPKSIVLYLDANFEGVAFANGRRIVLLLISPVALFERIQDDPSCACTVSYVQSNVVPVGFLINHIRTNGQIDIEYSAKIDRQGYTTGLFYSEKGNMQIITALQQASLERQ